MKDIEELNKSNVPIVVADKSLNQYTDQIVFKEKVDKANEAVCSPGFEKWWASQQRKAE